MKNNQRGITLVALVITIIVLLILAGVTIAALSGDNGILTNASKSQQENALGNAKDTISMAINEATNAYYSQTYLNDTSSNVVDGQKGTTAAKFILAATSGLEDVSVTIDNAKTAPTIDGTTKTSAEVKITTTDKNPVYVTATLNSEGGLSKWSETKK